MELGLILSTTVAFATLLAMLMAVVRWGLKLEGRLEALQEKHFALSQEVNVGILPRAQERIDSIHERLDHIDKQLYETTRPQQ